jgi:hypothetical protein
VEKATVKVGKGNGFKSCWSENVSRSDLFVTPACNSEQHNTFLEIDKWVSALIVIIAATLASVTRTVLVARAANRVSKKTTIRIAAVTDGMRTSS